MGGIERRRTLSGAMGHRGVFQAAQANPPSLRLPRPQQGGDPLAALGGVVALRADALARPGGGLGAQLLAVIGSGQGRGVGSD